MFQTRPSFTMARHLKSIIKHRVQVLPMPTYGRLSSPDPMNGTCTVIGRYGDSVNVEIREGYINRVVD